MCTTCGCSDDAQPQVTNLQTGKKSSIGTPAKGAVKHAHEHSHDGHSHSHEHAHDHAHSHGGSDHSHDHDHSHDSPDHLHAHDHEHGHIHDHDHSHNHLHAQESTEDHSHDHVPAHDHEQPQDYTHKDEEYFARLRSPDLKIGKSIPNTNSTTISLEEQILGKNDQLAENNRAWFKKSNVLTLNLVSSPGAGKTALLECTIKALQNSYSISVVEGDQATLNDAERIKKTGCKVVQINTGAGCHLDAEMVASGIKQLDPPHDSIVFIENVGNLVCPALFDLGEKCKVAMLSITEGEDKPVKYPHMFRASEILLLTKMDLLPHLTFDVESCKRFALSVNPRIKIFEVSALSGEGMETWYQWIKEQTPR